MEKLWDAQEIVRNGFKVEATQVIFQARRRRDRGVPCYDRKIKKRRGKHRVEEWATDSFT